MHSKWRTFRHHRQDKAALWSVPLVSLKPVFVWSSPLLTCKYSRECCIIPEPSCGSPSITINSTWFLSLLRLCRTYFVPRGLYFKVKFILELTARGKYCLSWKFTVIPLEQEYMTSHAFFPLYFLLQGSKEIIHLILNHKNLELWSLIFSFSAFTGLCRLYLFFLCFLFKLNFLFLK